MILGTKGILATYSCFLRDNYSVAIIPRAKWNLYRIYCEFTLTVCNYMYCLSIYLCFNHTQYDIILK